MWNVIKIRIDKRKKKIVIENYIFSYVLFVKLFFDCDFVFR